MAPGRPAVVLLAVGVGMMPLRAADGLQTGDRRYRATDSGIAVELTIDHVRQEETGGPLREGDEVAVTVAITDEASGKPMSGVFPNAWMSRQGNARPAAADAKRCRSRVASFASGSLFSRPDLDLNVYHVLALNADPTITVVDPHFAFGGTQLLALVQLRSPGEDWALSADQSLLFVSLPDSGIVSVIDTLRWTTVRNLEVGPSPRRIVRQQDGAFVWVATDDGVAAVHGDGSGVAFRIATGAGPHDLALASDNRFAFVTNRDAGTTSVIDIHTRQKTADVASGKSPVTVAYSSRSAMAYVGSDADGAITVIDPRQPTAPRAIAASAGLRQIRIAPSGGHVFAVNPTANVVQIIDAALNRLVQTADIQGGPFEVTFTTDLAYVRQLRSELVTMIPLTGIGGGQPVAVADFPGGERPFGVRTRATPADGVVQAPGERAVLVANAGDRAIYYYQEGMAAPMGNFNNYSHEPRAVMVVDRTLREAAPGVYRTAARLARPGSYDLALLVNAPRLIACFDVRVDVNPVLEAQRRPAVRLEPVAVPSLVRVGEPVTLRVRIVDSATGRAREGLTDVRALISLAPGQWQARAPLRALGEGEYALEFVSPAEGVYSAYVESPSAGLRLNNPMVLSFQAIPR